MGHPAGPLHDAGNHQRRQRQSRRQPVRRASLKTRLNPAKGHRCYTTRWDTTEVWLVGEWRSNGERKFHLSNQPARTSRRTLAATLKARWVCEQAHQQLKQELGLGAFEGRSWTGLHRHALMGCIAFAYLQHLRLKAAARRGEKAAAPCPATEADAA